jgi:DNA-binding HxlR family transcriptional regulator
VARTKGYQHYCVIARSLEIIGEKWSLLLVRDLLRGPQRFTDLLRYMGGITPKWLTARLRELEQAGIVERESTPGKREVWYRLTEKGRDLAPVVEGLANWGIKYGRREPLPGEPVFPEMFLQATSVSLNRSKRKPESPIAWEFQFGEGARPVTLRFDGERWTSREVSGEADAAVFTTTEQLLAFLSAAPAERGGLITNLQFSGKEDAIAEFRRTFVREPKQKSRTGTTANAGA